MTISSSLNAGVAGLSANASRLAAISDNIANSGTYGYKRVETEFHSMVLTKDSGAYSAGGVRATNQRLVDEKTTLISTANPTDLAIRGKGMLPVTSRTGVEAGTGAQNMMLTTTGSFRPDSDGYLTTQSNLVLMGWPANPDGTIPNLPRDTADGLVPIQVNNTQLVGQPTTSMTLGVNLPATETMAGAAGDVQVLSVEYYDNLGITETVHVTYTPTVPAAGPASNEWTMTLTDSASGGAVIGEYTLVFDDSRTSGGTLLAVTTVSGGAYDPATGSAILNVAGGPMELNVGALGASDGMTQLSDTFAPLRISKDGAPVGNMVSVEVDSFGMVHAIFDTGFTQTIYQVPVADVQNYNGLISLDGQAYQPSPDSGAFFLWDSGSGPTGEITGFAREESATDVAGELTDMIQTQRAYSSNAKVIQTVDEMLQETTNIKR